ncbi:putative GTP-binding protein EngB [Labeo rohita]|uniref:GTP-binding protein EngB n=1 Tax=Labeo rohita TaxID=84645 RepID=A0ABQ8MN28_LABRO|nr:putative GTP-binding protein EngB [Labeo rohita]
MTHQLPQTAGSDACSSPMLQANVRPMLQGKHVLVRTDNIATVAYINSPAISSSRESSYFQVFYSLTKASLSMDTLAHSWPRGLLKYTFPPVSLLAQTLCKIREDEEQVLLVALYWPTRTWFANLKLLCSSHREDPQRYSVSVAAAEAAMRSTTMQWILHAFLVNVPTTPFRAQVVNLQSQPPEEGFALPLCCCVPFVPFTFTWNAPRASDALSSSLKGNAVAKQRLAHWVVDVITLAYQCQGEPSP